MRALPQKPEYDLSRVIALWLFFGVVGWALVASWARFVIYLIWG